jgi:nicotinate-nucleotide pyrophosphorylase (carboxylating)
MKPLKYRLTDKVKEFLAEDIGYGDITSEVLIPESLKAKGELYFKEPGVVSGLAEFAAVFELLGCSVELLVSEGEKTEANKILVSVEGSARALLMGERIALNLVSRMAGIATQTAETVEIVAKHNSITRVAATRKTAPGLREFDKRAVAHGGGDPHRFGLDDCVLIKDNHLKLVPDIMEAVKLVRSKISFTKKVEVEVRNLSEATEAARAGADIIMFDNMSPVEIKCVLRKLGKLGLREGIIFEASGGITLSNAGEYAEAGVEVVSLGCLTHSVQSLDVKFGIEILI